VSDQTRDILHAIGRRLDDARELLDAAVARSTALERNLRGHEYAVNDLHWDAAKVLLDPDPDRPALRAVRTGAEQLLEQLRDSTIAADQIHDQLSAAGGHLRHTDRLIGALGASTHPVHAGQVAALANRAERLASLIEVATPLADRAHQQLRSAREALESGVTASADPNLDGFAKFGSLDRGVIDTTRQLAAVRISSRDGAELTEHAVHSGTVTAASARDLLRHHQQRHPPAPTPPGPSGPSGPAI